jgi:glycosyltransferase involved in cell wall biosynthesis
MDEATISIIVPTWNEAPLIGDAVTHALAVGDEVLVVDGTRLPGRAPTG